MKQKTKKIFAGTIAVLLLIALIFSFFSTLLVFAYAADVSQSSVSALRAEITELENQRKSLEKQLGSLSSEKSKLLKNKSLLERESALNQQQIEKKELLIEELEKSVNLKAEELVNAQEQENEQYEMLKTRVRVMYENGSIDYLDVLLSSESFSDMLSRFEIISQIVEYDGRLMGKLTASRQLIDETKQQLEDEMNEQISLKASLETTRKNIAEKLKQSEQLSEQIAEDEETVKAIYEEMEAEEEQLQAELKRQVAELAKTGSYVGGTMTWPLPGYTYISSPFGMRLHPTLKVYKLHTGVDIPAPAGTKILAANSGTVIISAYSNAWGNYVVINHGGGIATLYAHMTKRLVSKGDTVTLGQVIGTVGTTGYSTGNHLHFELQRNGKSEDPFEKEFSK